MAPVRGRYLAMAALFLCLALPFSHAQKTTSLPDSMFYTTYYPATTFIDWYCGGTEQKGCSSFGVLQPFKQACAFLEGNPVLSTFNTVVRNLYVLDAGTGAGDVLLYVYRKTDTVTANLDAINITLIATVPLPSQSGGPNTPCSMAANDNYIYLGTHKSTIAVRVTKSTLALADVDAVGSIRSITANGNGFVSVAGYANGTPLHVVYDPKGEAIESGGGESALPSTINAVPIPLSF